MRIVVFGATGNVGRQVVLEALRRGHEVTGVVRDPAAVQSPDPRARLERGDATDPSSVARIVKGADAVVSAISPRPNPRGLPAPKLADNARAIIQGLRDSGVKRVLYVVGASSLEVAPGKRLFDQPGFPDIYRAEALEGIQALDIWRSEAQGLDWTCLSPADVIFPGERTGKYRTTDDRLIVDAEGKSRISFEDFAVAILDELEKPNHVGKRFGVAY
jgi:uncharacterized protein